MTVRFFYDNNKIELDTSDKLIQFVTSTYQTYIHQKPVLKLFHTTHDQLYVLLSERGCCLIYESHERDCYLTLNPDADKAESLVFIHERQTIYMSGKNCVPFDRIIKELLSFFEIGCPLLNMGVSWEYWGKVDSTSFLD